VLLVFDSHHFGGVVKEIKPKAGFGLLVLIAGLGFLSPAIGQKWWMDEPVRLVQTNLLEGDAVLDVKKHLEPIAEFPANTLLFNLGGIVAFYPTAMEYHYPSIHLPAGRDLFGEVLKEAHARGIRVVGRFDLSRTRKPVFDARPEWFFQSVQGEPAIYNGLYSTCINGGYYRDHALKILNEALERYEVDGLFFNMFGNPSHDYSGNALGPCQCDACRERFSARYNRPLPTAADSDYQEFMFISSREVAAAIAELIHRKRPGAAFLTYIQQHTDVIMSESNTAVGRPLPLWPYSASDNVNRARNSEPAKMAINLCMSFVDYPWRFVTVPQAEVQLRLYQNMAHGAGPAFVMLSTPDQEDRQAVIAARPVFKWHAEHEDLYVGQQSRARVLLLGGGQNSYRGYFRLLSEQHIPFAVSDNLRWLEEPGHAYELVVAPQVAAESLEPWVRKGGRLLISGVQPPSWLNVPVVERRQHTQGYWRVRNHRLLPSLRDTNLLMLDGEYVELRPFADPILTLIPPAMYGPPEKVWSDKVETDVPGLWIAEHGKGKVAYVPWDIGGLYYRHSSQGHAGLMTDLVDLLLPRGRQLRTDAHPLVEITVMEQPRRKRLLIHFVNLSGHSGTAYFRPLPIGEIRVELAEEFQTARSVAHKQELPVTENGSYRSFVLPALKGYDVVVLE
jgi:hypothetical protein